MVLLLKQGYAAFVSLSAEFISTGFLVDTIWTTFHACFTGDVERHRCVTFINMICSDLARPSAVAAIKRQLFAQYPLE